MLKKEDLVRALQKVDPFVYCSEPGWSNLECQFCGVIWPHPQVDHDEPEHDRTCIWLRCRNA